nr:RNA-directed DNA polymerase, eukaryota [Tanacetum cinerariifolium]
MNKKRSQLIIRGTLANGEWISEPHRVKNEFFTHFKKQHSPFQAPSICFDFTFSTRLSSYQVQDLERTVTYEEVKRAVWDCGTNKSPGPDRFSFEFYRYKKMQKIVNLDHRKARKQARKNEAGAAVSEQ